MKTTSLKAIALAAATLLGAASASAIAIDGTLEYSLNDTEFSFDSTSVDFATPPNGTVTDASGDFAGLLGMDITHVDFTYDPFPGAYTPLLTIGGFSFDLTDIFVAEYTVDGPFTFLKIAGVGVGTWAGYDETQFSWTFSADSNNGVTNYSATLVSMLPPVTVPDGSTTLTLLGFGCAAVLVGSRARVARKA